MITRSPSGHRCGESHQKAKLTDAQVREMRRRNQEDGIGFVLLGREFGCSKWTARDIVQYHTRITA